MTEHAQFGSGDGENVCSLVCSWNWMKNSARKPAERTTTRGGWDGSLHRKEESLSRSMLSRLCAMTMVKEASQSGFVSSTAARVLVSATPSTLSLSSASNRTASEALFFPMLWKPSRKKLFPASGWETDSWSRMVKWPVPGRTRFFRMDVDVARAEMTSTRAASSADWPLAAQRLSKGTIKASFSERIVKTYRNWRS